MTTALIVSKLLALIGMIMLTLEFVGKLEPTIAFGYPLWKVWFCVLVVCEINRVIGDIYDITR